MLRSLTLEGFAVLHLVGTDNGTGPIDFVVVGPSGVYVIETRDWRGNVYQATKGRLMCNGQDRSSAIDQAIAEAGELRRRLEPLGVRSVDAIVALADARVRHPMTFRRVRVTSARDAVTLIRSAPVRLTREQVARVSSALMRPHPVGRTKAGQDPSTSSRISHASTGRDAPLTVRGSLGSARTRSWTRA